MKKAVLTFAVAFMILTNVTAQTDIEGAKDNPYISRFKDSWITWQQLKNFDRYFVLSLKDHTIHHYEIDGKVLRTQYRTTKDHSVFEIFKSYEQALQDAGYEILVTFDEKNCGVNLQEQLYNREFSGLNALPREADKPDYQNEFAYFAAKKDTGEKDIYIIGFIVAWGEPLITLDVIEVKKMDDNLVTAKKLNETIGSKGHAVLKGIYFDTGKASLQEKSGKALQNIADYLNAHKDQKFFVVGHTDNTGDFEANKILSENRAKTVMQTLVNQYGIDANQLKAFGIANLAPIASNETQEGKALNRRVEIVLQ